MKRKAEDEKAVRHILRTALELQGYKVLCASNPDEAEELFTQNHDQVTLLLTDFIMPGCTGLELYQRWRQSAPS